MVNLGTPNLRSSCLPLHERAQGALLGCPGVVGRAGRGVCMRAARSMHGRRGHARPSPALSTYCTNPHPVRGIRQRLDHD